VPSSVIGEGLGASTRVTSGSRSAVRGIAPGAGRSQVARGSTGVFTSGTVAAAVARGAVGSRRPRTAAPSTVGGMRSPAPLLRSALAGAAAVVLLTACGGSGDEEPAAASSTSAPATASSAPSSGTAAPDPAAEEFCGQMTTAFTELQGTLGAATPEEVAGRLPEVVTTLEQVEAPAEIAGDWGALVDGLRRLADTTGALDLGTPEGRQAYSDAEARIGAELGPAQSALTDYVVANCGLTSTAPPS
jgi:hypothetical protein